MGAPHPSVPGERDSGSCRFCGQRLTEVFADLGVTPLANSYLSTDEVRQVEPFYPLRAMVCGGCFLVQLEDYETPETFFSRYAYFSSYSTSWLDHSRRYAETISERLGLDVDSKVVEVASNDGYLLRYFKERSIPVLGIEPAENVARVAIERGIPTLVEFFGRATAERIRQGWSADLLIANNVLAHVPDLNDFVGGLKGLLSPEGVVTVEFPHLPRLVEENQFDTIYHEHFSYFSFLTARRVFEAHDLSVFDVDELPTHGGSLRLYACHASSKRHPVSERVAELSEREKGAGYGSLDLYRSFEAGVPTAKRELLTLLIDLKLEGKTIVGYGAPAKGNTLLNYCGIGHDFFDYTVDVSPHKQGLFLPGSRIPIKAPNEIRQTRPDVVFILPWNLKDEIADEHSYIKGWGGKFAVRTPELQLFSPE